MKNVKIRRNIMFKRIISVLLAIMLPITSFCTLTAYAKEGNEADGEYYTYYFLAPAEWFATNDSIGLYYFTPNEKAAWPGIEITADDRVYVYDDGSAVYKVKIWQENESTENGEITTPCIYFNSFVDQNIDSDNFYFTNNINTEGYLPMDEILYGSDTDVFPRYPENFEIYNFNNMIYVPNTDVPVVSDFSYKPAIGAGVWYYYYGNGEYGTERTQSGKCGENVTWEFDFVIHTLTINGEGDMNGDCGWKKCSYADITSIIIGDEVTSIADEAFCDMPNLTNIKFGKKLIKIGESAFRNCTAVNSIEFPDSLSFIGVYAFMQCDSLKSVTIPKSVLNIGIGAFSNCAALEKIEVSSDNPEHCSSAGILYNKDKTVLLCCPGKRISITIPDTVKKIAACAFWGCKKLKSVTAPNGLENIDERAFQQCESLTSIVLPEGLLSIGELAFGYCANLKGILLPLSINDIHAAAFSVCDKLTAYVAEGSYAHSFVKDYNIKYLLISDALGDANGDNDISMDDVVLMQKNIAKLIELAPIQRKLADVTKDGDITMLDVTTVQKYIAKLINKF